MAHYTWTSSNGIILQLDDAIVDGKIENETVYLCRIKPFTYYSIGIVIIHYVYLKHKKHSNHE